MPRGDELKYLDRRIGPELTLPKQRFQVAQALDVGDVEVEAGLVDKRVHHPDRPWTHGIDAEMHDALPRQPLRGLDVHPRIVGGISGRRKGTRVMSGAE